MAVVQYSTHLHKNNTQNDTKQTIHTVRPFTESDDTRGCNNKICPPEVEQGTARNMLRIIM